jgi:hypothetical protein
LNVRFCHDVTFAVESVNGGFVPDPAFRSVFAGMPATAAYGDALGMDE